jgi:hypothetical protein
MNAWSTIERRLTSVQTVRLSVAGALTAAVAVLLTASGSAAPAATPDRVTGWRSALGKGDVTSFAELQPNGAPKTVGIAISGAALASLPPEPSDQHHCFDRDGDGVTSMATECAHTHEYAIPLPDAVSQRDDMPFKWVLLNWNMHGHMPPGIYDVPHFDVHFYMVPIEDVFAIHDGPCGPELVNCEQFAIAKLPVPDGMMHPDFQDVDAVAPAMGNHLIDVAGHEFHGMPFTMSWIYGVYSGRVTFYEQMVALDFLQSRPNACQPIKSPPSVAQSGYYPTQRCVKYDAGADAYVVSLEGFVHRAAS